jgi:ABC-type nickel/cobalt efflux system permease component RcnA
MSIASSLRPALIGLLLTALALPAFAQGAGPREASPATEPGAAGKGAGSYFGQRAHPAPAGPESGPYFGAPPKPEAGPGIAPSLRLPYWARVMLTRVAEVQRRINAALTGEVRRLHTPDYWAAVGTLFLLSFLYGVFHAVGPGHGKVVTTAYLATRNARFRHALLMCGANALAQSLTAIVLVGGFAVVVDLGSEWILGKSIWLEHLSYGLIAAVGGVMLLGALTGREHRHGGEELPRANAGTPTLRELLATAAAVGIRPCSGAILVLLFTLANHVFLVGVLATLLMGLGVALTLSVMGAATVGARVAIGSLVSGHSRLGHVAARAMSIGAGALLLLLGLLLLFASLMGGSLGG